MTETVKLATFLKDRCERGRYGLRYLNQENTLVYIPWPVAPRPNEGLTPAFEMFKEWACLSFKKRNQDQETNEQPTTQKHRFRNALSRADGITYRKDITVSGGRVYEFKESRSRRSHSHETSSIQPSPINHHDENFLGQYGTVNGTVTPYTPHTGYNAQIGIIPQPESPFTYEYGSSPQMETEMYENDFQFAPEPSNNWQVATTDQNQQVVDDIILDMLVPPDSNEYLPEIQPVAKKAPQPQIVPLGQPVTRVDERSSGLRLSLRFRNEEVFQHFVTNTYGCRLYFGDNIPDITQLVEPEHLSSITRPFRYQPEQLFGPDCLEQVRLPQTDHHMKTQKQREKTNSILENMERGLILYLDNNNASQCSGIPDVYAMRLCQTRIFPYSETIVNDQGQAASQSESLKRMVWYKVFDAQQFCQKLDSRKSSSNFCLSLGQRSTDDTLLVSLTVTVQLANHFIQNQLDNEHSDILISGATSMDEEAHKLAVKLKETVTL
uniref:Interferon regulatory factor 6-like n=1 Tax=Phallusia mammillata TaxID=59560 RepID=A0A6F9DG14_9ASCI|nr:interferon regulatory factor 6-like [Phallusia mammillata]